LSIYSEIANVV